MTLEPAEAPGTAIAATTPPPPKRGGLLDLIERAGNALPNPATLFLVLAAIVAIASWICTRAGVSVIHPKDGSILTPVNLLDAEGIRRMWTEAVRNFTGFAPLGTVLVAMLGIGVAEATGLIGVAMRAAVMAIPRSLLTAAVVFIGINANQAADAGIIILPPLGAALFAAAGRHPLAGLAAAFAGVSGGFSANLLPSTLDVLLVGFTQEAVNASRLFGDYPVSILGNWYFLAVSTPILTLSGTWITERVVEPRLGKWNPELAGDAMAAGDAAMKAVLPGERRGLIAAGIGLAFAVALMLALTWRGAPLRVEGATLIDQLKPFFDSMVMWVVVIFLLPGLAYGWAIRKIRNDHDVVRLTGEVMGTMGTYIVLAFACAQFVAFFAWSNLAAILAIAGAGLLRDLGLQGVPMMVGFILFAMLLNLFTTSASAKWGVLAPVFVPMFALLGLTPEGTQAVYRVGDSCTNIVTPLLPYMPFIITAAQRYDRRAGPGTIVSLMVPYFVGFALFWITLLLAFYVFGWPIGPGVTMRLPG
jgi:aminobenzoyl-glutamate transport protein